MQKLHSSMQGLQLTLPSGWLAASAEARWAGEGRGRGVFAMQSMPRGTLICVFGGCIVEWPALQEMDAETRRMALQVDDELFLLSTQEGPSDWVNHSCDPNAGMSGQISLVAMRPIRAGEEITFDYAMTDSLAYDEFGCACGAAACRGRVTSADWASPVLQRRYEGYFSPYLARRIQSSVRSRARA